MHVNTLVELAVQRALRNSLRGLAEQMGVSSGVLSEWKSGTKPIPDERIQQLAKIAGQDAGPWLLLIHSEQDQGELGREWAKLYKRLASTALVVAIAAGTISPAFAMDPMQLGIEVTQGAKITEKAPPRLISDVYHLSEVSKWRKLAAILRFIARIFGEIRSAWWKSLPRKHFTWA